MDAKQKNYHLKCRIEFETGRCVKHGIEHGWRVKTLLNYEFK